jgi:DNA-binding transcriptional LysR family regulator
MVLFAQIARSGGVRAAARAENTSRSHLSRRLAALEERIGTQLIERDEAHFALTDAGTVFLSRVEGILRDVRDAEELARAAGGRVRGLLRVATSPLLSEVAMESVVLEYLERHPDVSVDLRVAPERIDLRRSSVDLAFRTGPLPDDSGMRCRAMAGSVTAMYASDRYLAKFGHPEDIASLAEHSCILVGKAHKWSLPGGTVAPKQRIRVNNYRFAKRAAVAGAGIARFASVYADEELQTGRLRLVLPDQTTTSTLFAVFPSAGRMSLKVRSFLQLAEKYISDERLCPPMFWHRLRPSVGGSTS